MSVNKASKALHATIYNEYTGRNLQQTNKRTNKVNEEE